MASTIQTEKIPDHPGKILKERFLTAYNISIYRLAKDLNVPPNRITRIINDGSSISLETGLLLSRYFNLPDKFWLDLQLNYDIAITKAAITDKLNVIKVIDNTNIVITSAIKDS